MDGVNVEQFEHRIMSWALASGHRLCSQGVTRAGRELTFITGFEQDGATIGIFKLSNNSFF